MLDPRDPRGVRHALVVMLALTACAVLAGATSLPAVGEWITDAPPSVPIRCPRSGACRRRRRCVGCWAASTATRWTGRWAAGGPTGALGPTAGCTQWRTTARPRAERPGPRAARFIYSPPATTSPAWSKSEKEWVQPLDFLVVQAFDQYFDERHEILGAGVLAQEQEATLVA
ncbi:transposase family protein [Streptomyces sp. NBC_00203]|uniref:transposase family protein n=1 Tax=Streptomyces sp. NBC_00203 TaxID=2975680 RepID=UPI00324783FC